MNNKKQQNTFISGMMLDSHPSTASDTMLTNCLNGTLITYGDNQYVLQNDLGNGKIYSDKEKQNPAQLPHELFFNQETESKYSLCENLYRPVGMKEHNGILYIVSQNIKSKLYYQYKENPTINEWKKADTVTLSVSNTCKYIINIEVNVPNNSSLSTQKVGYLKHYNDQGEEVDSAELTVEQFLLRIKNDINKIDFQEIRHLDDEDSIVYKGSEIGSFPSPQYGNLDGIFCQGDDIIGDEDSKIVYQEQLYDSDGYKLDDSNLNFGDYFEILFNDGGELEYKTTDDQGNEKIVKINTKVIDLSPYKGNNGNINQNNLFQLKFYLDYDNKSIDLNKKGKIQYFYYKDLYDKSNTFPRFTDDSLTALYKLKMEEYGKLVVHCNKSNLGSFIPSVFVSDEIEDPEYVYLIGNVLITYNCPDGLHYITNADGTIEPKDFSINSGLNLISYRTNLLSEIQLVVNDNNTITITDLLEDWSKKEIWNYQIQRKLIFDNFKINRNWIEDSQYINLDLKFIGKHVINPEAKPSEYIWETNEVLMPINTFNFKLDTKTSITDGIILTGFSYIITKDSSTEQDKTVKFKAAFALKTKALKGKTFDITAVGYSLDWTVETPISESVGIKIYDHSRTPYDYDQNIQIINVEGSYSLSDMEEGFILFIAEIDEDPVKSVFIDMQYVLHYNNFIVSSGDDSTANILNYSLFRQDINNSERETGRIIPYSVEIKDTSISDSIEIELTNILNNGNSIFYNPIIFGNIPEELTFVGACNSLSILGEGNLIYNDSLSLDFTNLYSTSNLKLNSDSVNVLRHIKEEYDVRIDTSETVGINKYAIQTEIPISYRQVNYYNQQSLYTDFILDNLSKIVVSVEGDIDQQNFYVYINGSQITPGVNSGGNYTTLTIKSSDIISRIEQLLDNDNARFGLIQITLFSSSTTYVIMRKTESGWNYLDYKNSNLNQIQSEYYSNKAYIVRDNPPEQKQQVDCYYYSQASKNIEYNAKLAETVNILKYHTTNNNYNMPYFIQEFSNKLKEKLQEDYSSANVSDNIDWQAVIQDFYKTSYNQKDTYLEDTINTKFPIITEFDGITDFYKWSVNSRDFNCCYVKYDADPYISENDYMTYLANKYDSYIVYYIGVRDDFIAQETKQCLYSIYDSNNQKTITSFKIYKEDENDNNLFAKLNEFDPLQDGTIQLSYKKESTNYTVNIRFECPTNDYFYNIKDKSLWEHYDTLKVVNPDYYFPVILP